MCVSVSKITLWRFDTPEEFISKSKLGEKKKVSLVSLVSPVPPV